MRANRKACPRNLAAARWVLWHRFGSTPLRVSANLIKIRIVRKSIFQHFESGERTSPDVQEPSIKVGPLAESNLRFVELGDAKIYEAKGSWRARSMHLCSVRMAHFGLTHPLRTRAILLGLIVSPMIFVNPATAQDDTNKNALPFTAPLPPARPSTMSSMQPSPPAPSSTTARTSPAPATPIVPKSSLALANEPSRELPPASRARMHACVLEWQKMKMTGEAAEKIWRTFAQICLVR